MADLESIASNTLSRTTLAEDQLRQEVAALGPRWTVEGIDLRCDLRGAAMTKCGEAAAYASVLADEMDHHPRILLEYAGMTLTVHTHDKMAITVTDLVYAARFERWLRQNGWA
ncbi:MAG TPA: 4a-hydroxytetrahydrobiopterin dehydratase [Kofleriaceae bacterium]